MGYIAARLPSKGDLGTALDCVRAEELLLAYACVQGDPHALAYLDRQVFSQVQTWFPGQDSAVVAEIGQRLRQRLLMAAPPAVPKLATFTGRGTLTRWARAIAIRLLADIQQERSNPVPLRDITPENDALVGCDPELDFIRGRYAEPFRLAFQEALGALTPRERNLLRLHHLDNLSVDSVGTMYQTSRSTAARWIAKARQHLLERTRDALSARLALEPRELDSLMAMLPSHLDISIHRLLQP
ncbi:sigma-70 family RNA polymerase sigma factor [Myxococcus sp. 1LA]